MSGQPLSVGVLHPTFESWGGAEWFIHGLLETWSRTTTVRPVLYTYRWIDPPGGGAVYEIVTHGHGGVLSGPRDWRAVGRRFRNRWQSHDVLFVHNHPAGQWARNAEGSPPVVWYCHEPPRALWDGGAFPRPRLSTVARIRETIRGIHMLGVSRALPRLAGRLVLAFQRRTRGDARWKRFLQTRDMEAVANTAAVIANSRYTAGRIAEIYGRDATVAYPLLPWFDSDLPTVREKRPVVLWVGRLAEEKRPSLVLDAWEKTVARHARTRYRLVMVGDGPLRSEVENRIMPLVAAGKAEFHRNLPHEALLEFYRTALLTVHVALREPFGLVPLESMWNGTAVLAHCEGGVAETVIPGETGFCLDDASPTGLSRALSDILSAPSEVTALGRRAATAVRGRFRFADTLETIETVLRRAAALR